MARPRLALRIRAFGIPSERRVGDNAPYLRSERARRSRSTSVDHWSAPLAGARSHGLSGTEDRGRKAEVRKASATKRK
jgi:hypothetical protein